jgi:hypothetical protein
MELMNRMKPVLIIILTTIALQLQGQQLTPAELKDFRLRQDSLKKLAFSIVNDQSAAVRFRSDSSFTKIMVRALLKQHSFQFSFDSLQSISRLYSEDSVFRIFTWQVVKDDNYCRQRGFIQMKTKDGSLRLFPLRDVSEFTQAPVDTIANNMGWIGAVYYRIVMKEHEGRKFYTLFGYDENNIRTTRKWLDVLWFDEMGAPVFGRSNVFTFAKDSVPKPPVNRYLLEYKKDARARVQYDEEAGIIIFDHLISESNEPQKKYTLIPDGDYEGFEWKNGQWQHIDKVFDFKLKDGEAPVPEALDENKQKVKTTTPPKKTSVPVKKKPGGGS